MLTFLNYIFNYGDDIIIDVVTRSILLKNFIGKPEHIIIGESGTGSSGSQNSSDTAGISNDVTSKHYNTSTSATFNNLSDVPTAPALQSVAQKNNTADEKFSLSFPTGLSYPSADEVFAQSTGSVINGSGAAHQKCAEKPPNLFVGVKL